MEICQKHNCVYDNVHGNCAACHLQNELDLVNTDIEEYRVRLNSLNIDFRNLKDKKNAGAIFVRWSIKVLDKTGYRKVLLQRCTSFIDARLAFSKWCRVIEPELLSIVKETEDIVASYKKP